MEERKYSRSERALMSAFGRDKIVHLDAFEVHYLMGYQDAEKDLALTWNDIYAIIYIHMSMLRESEWQAAEVEDRCKEILRRFNVMKEEGK